MKELSIEEKAKRYDEAIKKAESLYKVAEPMSGCNVIIETIFPELKESEDERIRKALIKAFEELLKQNNYDKDTNFKGVNSKEAIAWLEKQAEHANFRNKIQIGDKVTRNRDGILVNLSQLKRVAKKDEKQGEQPSDTDNKFIRMRETKPKDISEFLDRLTTVEQEFLWEHIAKIRELDKEEQKPTDKVEPKFKVGDWITFYGDKPFKILKVESEQNGILDYLLLSQNGHNSYYNKKYVDENARLWTIQDAKEGDVLFIGIDASTCIFKKLEGNLLYSYIISDGKLLVEDSHYYYEISDNISPATKEQRDLLFSKMKEAGYEWDAEKLELKKIEQKPVECLCVPSREIIMNVWELGNIWKELTGGNISTEHGTQLEYIQKHWTEGDYFDKIEQKPAWSEEDEDRLKSCLNILQAKGIMGVTETINTKWLKSLKDRVQPKQEWSGKDKVKIDDLCDFIEKHGNLYYGEVTKANLIDWLKSLKNKYIPQSKQEWSEEDIDMIDWLIRCCEKEHEELCNDKYGHQDIVSDLKRDCRKKWDWIESLKNKVVPQNRWKPSAFHLECIEDAINLYEKRGINAIGLKEILDELKKLKE